MSMIVITKIETVSVLEPVTCVRVNGVQQPCMIANTGEPVPKHQVKDVIVHGHVFHVRGKRIVMGMTNEAHEAIGGVFDIINEQGFQIEQLIMDRDALRSRDNRIKHSGFWTRLKWLFTGIK